VPLTPYVSASFGPNILPAYSSTNVGRQAREILGWEPIPRPKGGTAQYPSGSGWKKFATPYQIELVGRMNTVVPEENERITYDERQVMANTRQSWLGQQMSSPCPMDLFPQPFPHPLAFVRDNPPSIVPIHCPSVFGL
jgi:hypothetical protein